jgi:hypothetical protein
VTFRDKYVEITTHLLLGDAGKLSFNFISALDFLILLQKTQIANFDGSKYLFSIFCGVATSFSGGRSRSIRREPPTMGKQPVNFITCGCESSAPFVVIYKARR